MKLTSKLAASAFLSLLTAPALDAQCNSQVNGNWTRSSSNVDDVALARSVVFVNPFSYPIDVCRLAMRLSNGGCTSATARMEVWEDAPNGAPASRIAQSAAQSIPTNDGVVAGTFSSLSLAPGRRYHLVIAYSGNPCGFFGTSFVQRPASSTGQMFESWILTQQSGVTFWLRSDERIRFQLDYELSVAGQSQSFGTGCGASAPCGTSPFRQQNSNGNPLSGQNTTDRIAFEVRDGFGFPTRALCGLEMRMSALGLRPIDVDVEIWEDAGSVPGQRLGSAVATVPPASPSVVRVNFPGTVQIRAGSSYWISLDPRGQRLILPIERVGTPVQDATWNGSSWQAGPGQASWSVRTFIATSTPMVPRLVSNAPTLGSSLNLRLRNAAPNANASLLLGLSNPDFDLSALGATGCRLRTSGELGFPAVSDGFGSATVNVPVANDLALLGIELFAQYAVVQPVNAIGVATTNGVRLRIGTF